MQIDASLGSLPPYNTRLGARLVVDRWLDSQSGFSLRMVTILSFFHEQESLYSLQRRHEIGSLEVYFGLDI